MIAMIGFPNVVDVIIRIVFGRLEAWTCFQCGQGPAQIMFEVVQVVLVQLLVEYTFSATCLGCTGVARISPLIDTASQTARGTFAITEIEKQSSE